MQKETLKQLARLLTALEIMETDQGFHNTASSICNLLNEVLPEEPNWDSEVSDERIKLLWDCLGNVPIDEDECIGDDFHIWQKGTPREEIWQWFDEQHSKGLAWLMGVAEPSLREKVLKCVAQFLERSGDLIVSPETVSTPFGEADMVTIRKDRLHLFHVTFTDGRAANVFHVPAIPVTSGEIRRERLIAGSVIEERGLHVEHASLNNVHAYLASENRLVIHHLGEFDLF